MRSAWMNQGTPQVREKFVYPVPPHLRNAPMPPIRALGFGKWCQHIHDFEEHIADMEFLPDALHGQRDSKPTGIGHEVVIREYLEKVKYRRMG